MTKSDDEDPKTTTGEPQDDDKKQQQTVVDDEVMLSQLLTALAAGARAVQGLPLEDDLEYQSSFPEFRALVEDARQSLLDVLVLTLGEQQQQNNNNMTEEISFDSLNDPLLWETCMDVCDAMLEEAQAQSSSGSANNSNNNTMVFQEARNAAQSSFGRLLKGIVEMDKPQDVYPAMNQQGGRGRLDPFVPPIVEKHHATCQPLDLTLQPGHGLETARIMGGGGASGSTNTNYYNNNKVVAPAHHVPHVYQAELDALEFGEEQLQVTWNGGKTKQSIAPSSTSLTAEWVDTPQALQSLAKELESVSIMAMDLEAHSYRSFAGMICLIQITIPDNNSNNNNNTESKDLQTKNYLIDPFALWDQIPAALGPTLANQNVVKVMHGADSDVQWLQRDFGLYVVNLFDTGRAARTLQMSSAGYAHLLQHYVGITPDKTHQLSDWRQRPLPEPMKEYAIMDTHYLLAIYERLKYDLEQSNDPDISIRHILEESRKVSLIRYAPEPFKPDGYQALMNMRRRRQRGNNNRGGGGGGNTKTELNPTQEQVLKDLWDWRDQIARQCDESLAYVCSNQGLLRIALACPTKLTALQGLLQPMPPLVLRNAKQILGLVQRCVKPPFFKPATADQDEGTGTTTTTRTSTTPGPKITTARDNNVVSTTTASGSSSRSLMSPVLGTEALYRQAGWISPHVGDDKEEQDDSADVVATTTDDDEAEDSNELKPRRVLAVHENNQNYRSNSQFSSHSLQLGDDDEEEDDDDDDEDEEEEDDDDGSDFVDGMGPARVAHPQGMEQKAKLAQANAAHIRTVHQEKHGMIGLISPTDEMEEDDDEEDEEGEEEEVVEKAIQEEFVIPRSMREIYRISNRNRRNKKSSSPLTTEPSEKEAQELARADEILKARNAEGKKYFDQIPDGTPKRQRTKSTGTASLSSEEGTSPPGAAASREEDIAMMQEVGWISGKDEVESMLNQRHAGDGDGAYNNEGGDASSGEEDIPGKTTMNATTTGNNNASSKPFDYSNVGPIGAFSATPSANPFFSGAAVAGGHLSNQQGGFGGNKQQSKKKQGASNRGRQSRRQTERPDRSDGRAQAYKKR